MLVKRYKQQSQMNINILMGKTTDNNIFSVSFPIKTF